MGNNKRFKTKQTFMNHFVDYLLFVEMRALDEYHELTPLGRILARLPIEPRMGKMLILGCMFNSGDALSIVSASTSTSTEVFVTGRHNDINCHGKPKCKVVTLTTFLNQ